MKIIYAERQVFICQGNLVKEQPVTVCNGSGHVQSAQDTTIPDTHCQNDKRSCLQNYNLGYVKTKAYLQLVGLQRQTSNTNSTILHK